VVVFLVLAFSIIRDIAKDFDLWVRAQSVARVFPIQKIWYFCL